MRKKLLFFILFVLMITGIAVGIHDYFHWQVMLTTETFTESTEKIWNPNRGFYHIYGFLISDEPADMSEQLDRQMQKDKIVKARDVAGQSVGHFIGKIADGNPPFFNAQFNMCKFMEKEIPPFSLPVSFGAAEYRDKEIEIMEEIVQRQYYSVLTIVNRILEQVKNKYTQKKENTEAIPMES